MNDPLIAAAIVAAIGGLVLDIMRRRFNRRLDNATTGKIDAETEHTVVDTMRIVDEVARTAIANLRAELAEARDETARVDGRLDTALSEVAQLRDSLAAETMARHLAERATLARDQHIDLLEQHIINGNPPPPPQRPDFTHPV
ncbi:MAG TPA: hypothetical protein DDY88_08670 [Actinobacteria bacterium]|nr:hypothetical protein [Actinomycetota bacterium]